ncbi:5'-nucleotidase, partial [Pseudomonas syringae pv. tagetis]
MGVFVCGWVLCLLSSWWWFVWLGCCGGGGVLLFWDSVRRLAGGGCGGWVCGGFGVCGVVFVWVFRFLGVWEIRLEVSLFLGGLLKSALLVAFAADVFFVDQPGHCEKA